MPTPHPMTAEREAQIAAGRAMAAEDHDSFSFDPPRPDVLEAIEDTIAPADDSFDDDDQATDEDDVADELPTPLVSLASVVNHHTAINLRTANCATDEITVYPCQAPGRRGSPIGPVPLSVAPDTGLLEEVLGWFDTDYVEIHFARENAKAPYLRVAFSRANVERQLNRPNRPMDSKTATTQSELVLNLAKRQEIQERMIERMLELMQQTNKPAPTANELNNLSERMMNLMFRSFEKNMERMIDRMDDPAPKRERPQQSGGLDDMLRSIRELKKLRETLDETLGTETSDTDELLKIVGVFNGNSSAKDKEDAEHIARETARILDEQEAA